MRFYLQKIKAAGRQNKRSITLKKVHDISNVSVPTDAADDAKASPNASLDEYQAKENKHKNCSDADYVSKVYLYHVTQSKVSMTAKLIIQKL